MLLFGILTLQFTLNWGKKKLVTVSKAILCPLMLLKQKGTARTAPRHVGSLTENRRSKYHDLGGIKLLFVGRLKVLNYKNVQNRY